MEQYKELARTFKALGAPPCETKCFPQMRKRCAEMGDKIVRPFTKNGKGLWYWYADTCKLFNRWADKRNTKQNEKRPKKKEYPKLTRTTSVRRVK